MNNYNQSFGNGSDNANILAFGNPGGGPPAPDDIYPGISNNLGNATGNAFGDQSLPSNLPVPVAQVTEVVTADRAGGIASLLSFNQLKGYLDRMGGIDGIVNTFGKVQGFMKSVTQMAPMIKMLYNTFGGSKTKGGINSAKASTPKSKRKASNKKKNSVTTKKKSTSPTSKRKR